MNKNTKLILQLKEKLETLENRFGDIDYAVTSVKREKSQDNSTKMLQDEAMLGLYTALCVDTVDIWKQNAVRFYCPTNQNPKTALKSLPWANAVSSMGGFDDCGLNWVPPAGSTICIVYGSGKRENAYYIGTTWHRRRGGGKDSSQTFPINIPEYDKIYKGHRKGYYVGPDDETQVLPPWNTENYNGYDIDTISDFTDQVNAQKILTYPHIYGFKTPDKHMMKMSDGDPRCNRRWKRIEIMSGCGNWMCFKDDHLHHGGQWTHPDCVSGEPAICQEGGEIGKDVKVFDGNPDASKTAKNIALAAFGSLSPKLDDPPKEKTECEGKKSNKTILIDHPRTGHPETCYPKSQGGKNPFFKRKEECRPYSGPKTPQNNKCDLPQTGIQLLSISGHTFVMDDSVEEPQGKVEWERGTKPFDFGCNDKFVGRTYWKSTTGHCIEMSDVEEPKCDPANGQKLRGKNNYIRLLTATGNKIELNDHTISEPDCPGSPPNKGGERRGIYMESTSKHVIHMCDEENEQSSDCRKDGGITASKAKKAFVAIRSGYGLEILMKDDNKQDETVKQYIQIKAPQTDNKKRGPHFELFKEAPSGPGLVMLRVGGNYLISTYDNKYEVIGDDPDNPSDKIEFITKMKLVYTKDMYINYTKKSHLFYAKEHIFLLAGEDCGPIPDGRKGPCIGPVCVYDPSSGCIKLSDRVYATTSGQADTVSIFQLAPFCKNAQKEKSPKGLDDANKQLSNNLNNTSIQKFATTQTQKPIDLNNANLKGK
jgi:hypothetical protein